MQASELVRSSAVPNITTPLLAFLGAGGELPRVEAIDLAQDPWRMLPSWGQPPGESVYAVAPAPGRDAFAAGTRRGKILLLTREGQEKARSSYAVREFDQGAPVLSVRWTDARRLAVADASGRCLLWDSASPDSEPQSLETGSTAISSLCSASEDELAGLSTEGNLWFWNLVNGSHVKSRRLVKPPRLSACVTLAYWSARSVWAYPGEGGKLVLYDPRSDKSFVRDAHEGDFYALAELGDDLVTAGFRDGRLRLWPSDASSKPKEIDLGEGVVSLAVLDIGRAIFLLVFASGRSLAGAWNGNELQTLTRIQGADYRCAAGPRPELLRGIYRQGRDSEVRRLLVAAEEQIKQGRWEGFKELLARLEQLGRETQACELRIRKALARKNPLEELAARLALKRCASPGMSAASNLIALGSLLEGACLFSEAQAAYAEILSMDGDSLAKERLEQLEPRMHAIEGGKYAALSGESATIPCLVEAATLLGSPLRGRHQIGRFAPMTCPLAEVTPNDILERLRARDAADGQEQSAEPWVEELWWITPQGVSRASAILFRGDASDGLNGLEFALRIEPLASETRVSPFLLLNADRFGPAEPAAERNARAQEAYEGVAANQSRAESWCKSLLQATVPALRQILTGRRGTLV